MPDQDPNRIDPRYDPAFQRGYDGEVRTAPKGESALRRAAAVAPAPARQAVASATSSAVADAVAAPEPTRTPDAPAAASHAPVDDVRVDRRVDASVVDDGPDPATARDITRNPFYLAAAALAVVLIIGGTVWLNQGFAAIADDRTTTSVGYYAALAMTFGAPLVIGIGVAIVAALLFVLARTWRPREEPTER